MRVGSRQAWLGVIVLCLGWHGLAQAEAPKQDPKKLLAEGDRLADKEDYAGALLRYKEAYEQIVPKLRGLRFKESVNPGLMTREQLQKYMVELVTEELPEEKMVLMDRSLKAFGFVPATMLVKPTLMSLYSEEVAGFYHPKTKKIFLIKEADKPQPRGFLGALFGPPPDFDKDTQKVALAHEMAHALADQHFDLNALDEATKDDEDMAMALAAVIEGEATLVMMAEGMREGGGAQAVLKMSPQYVDFMFGLLKGFLPFATGKTFRTAPAIFRESLIFPYFKGMVFILHLTNRGGWEPVNAAFRDPPTSTEQILHPEKYREPRDVPTAIALPDMKAVIDEAWKKLGENVLGEFQISILLTGVKDAAQASAGWDGDRYAVFEGEAGKLGLVWLSTWDRPEDAKEFATAYARYLQEKKLATPSAPPLRKALPAPPLRKGGQGGVKAKDAAKPSEEGKTPESPAADLTLRVSRNGRVYHIQRKDADVAVIEGFSDAETDRLLEIVFNAEKKPKVFPEQAKK